jgi:hypothetical protein
MKSIAFIILLLSIISNLYTQDSLEVILTYSDDFGYIFPAADFNQDGFTDIITPRNGALHFYYGCSYPDTLADEIIEVEISPYLRPGYPSYGGDINGNGWNDLLVPILSTEIQYVYIFFGGENFNPDFNNPDIMLNAENYSYDTFNLNWYGRNTGADFNGDGYADFYANGTGPGGSYTGQVDIFFGGESVNTEVDFHIMGNYGDFLSRFIAVGNINGDRFDDLIISRTSVVSGISKIEIYLGGVDMNTTIDYEIYDAYPSGNWSLIADGDINGDGFDDIIYYDGHFNEIRIFLGGDDFDAQVDYIISHSALNLFYCDINNDGYSDLVNVRSSNSNIEIYFGGLDFDATSDISFQKPETSYLSLLRSCNMNDFNGDGNNDILIGGTIYTMENLVSNSEDIIVSQAIELANYPNPFNPTTTIQFSGENFAENQQITLEIYNIKGQRVKQFKMKNVKSKMNEVIWNGVDESGKAVSSGVYLYQIKSSSGIYGTKKMMLLK